MDKESSNTPDLSSLGSFDFTPDWAKKDAGVSVGKFRPAREDAPRRSEGPRGPKKFEGGADRKDFGNRPRGDSGGAGRKPFGGGDRKGFGERKGFGDRPRGDRPRFEPRPQPLDVEVKVLPETKALGTIIRKLQGDTHAYKLKDLAYFFLDNPQSVLLKISPRTGRSPSLPSGQPSTSNLQPPTCFYQCTACGFASTSRAEVEEHAIAAHIGDYFVAKEIDCEPPKGNFNCVAKCGLSGVLLGPPNIHEFNAVVKEMIRTRYPQMSEEQYRAHIEMVRDAEAIEQWRAGATKKTVFFAKGTEETEGAPSLTREQVEGEFRRTILASLVDQPKNLMITADVALQSPVKPLVWAARDAIEAERRAPYGMCFALRGAFHHRKLNFFRVNDPRGQEFVTSADYKAFDAVHAIPELAKVATFVAEHPCCLKQEVAPDAEAEKHLAWLVSTGHVVAFTNGVYSPVEKFPKYGPQWRKGRSKSEEGRSEEAERSVVEATVDAAVADGTEPVPPVATADGGGPRSRAAADGQEPVPPVADAPVADGTEPVPPVVEAPVAEAPVADGTEPVPPAVSAPVEDPVISEEKKEDETAAQLAQ